MARPSAYEKIIKPKMKEIKYFRSQGFTFEDIAKKIGVASSTLYKYKAEIEELKEVIKKATEVAVEELQETAFKLATGQYEAKTEEIKYDKLGQIITRTVRLTKQVDTTALIFLLKSYAPEIFNGKDSTDRGMVEAISEFAAKFK